MKGKKLSSEDLRLWDKVAESTQPLDKKKPAVSENPPKKYNLRDGDWQSIMLHHG